MSASSCTEGVCESCGVRSYGLPSACDPLCPLRDPAVQELERRIDAAIDQSCHSRGSRREQHLRTADVLIEQRDELIANVQRRNDHGVALSRDVVGPAVKRASEVTAVGERMLANLRGES